MCFFMIYFEHKSVRKLIAIVGVLMCFAAALCFYFATVANKSLLWAVFNQNAKDKAMFDICAMLFYAGIGCGIFAFFTQILAYCSAAFQHNIFYIMFGFFSFLTSVMLISTGVFGLVMGY